MKTKITANFCALVMLSALVAGCASTDKPASKLLELNLAHINDHHSHLDAFPAAELSIAGERTQVALGGYQQDAGIHVRGLMSASDHRAGAAGAACRLRY